MADDQEVGKELQKRARWWVSKLIGLYGLTWDSHRQEDAVQELFLAGWQVWRDTGQDGLAKNRMKDRAKNLLRDFGYELKHEPKAEVEFPEEDLSDPDNEKFSILEQPERRVNTVEEVIVREFLDRITPRQRQIVLLRSAEYSDQEIADKIGVSLRTVERELLQVRKEHKSFNAEK